MFNNNNNTNKMKTQRFTTNSGSFQNLLMSNNSTTPIVGEYCTEMLYTDRNVWLVREVSKDGKYVTIEACDPKKLDHFQGYGSDFVPNGYKIQLRWYRGQWRRVTIEYRFMDEFMGSLNAEERAEVREIGYAEYLRNYNPWAFKAIYNEDMEMVAAHDGIVEKITSMASGPFRVLFGRADHYRDPHF